MEALFRRLGLRPWSELTEVEKAAVRAFVEEVAGVRLEVSFFEASWWVERRGEWEQFPDPEHMKQVLLRESP